MFSSPKIAYSDKLEEERIFEEILKLVPSFKNLLVACLGHRRALLNLIRMVSLHDFFCVSYYFKFPFFSFKMLPIVPGMTTSPKRTALSWTMSNLLRENIYSTIERNTQCQLEIEGMSVDGPILNTATSYSLKF